MSISRCATNGAAFAALLCACGLAGPAAATERGPVGPAPKLVSGPFGTSLRAPAAHTACGAGGMAVRVAARWSRRALARPVRSIRLLLQRPGSEAVIASLTFAPAQPRTLRQATLRSTQCRPNLDVRYELFVGRRDVPHDHTSVVFRTRGTPAAN